jgi:hypothetical protein
MANASQQRMQENFLSILEDYTGIKHTKLSLSALWERTSPKEYRKIALSDHLMTLCTATSIHSEYADVESLMITQNYMTSFIT